MRCLACKANDIEDSTSTYFAQVNGCYVIIENVPCKKCHQCGETFYSMDVLEKIDGILENIEKIVSKVIIMDYTKAA